jgi:hypothetical protein
MVKSSESYKVYLEKSEAAPGGVHSTQPEGRAGLPPVCTVTEAKEEKGVAIECTRHQTGLNRYPINEHEEKHKTHGPNN